MEFFIFVGVGILILLILGVVVFLLTNKRNRVTNQQEQMKENERIIQNQRTI